jgi:hypothetical protein
VPLIQRKKHGRNNIFNNRLIDHRKIMKEGSLDRKDRFTERLIYSKEEILSMVSFNQSKKHCQMGYLNNSSFDREKSIKATFDRKSN